MSMLEYAIKHNSGAQVAYGHDPKSQEVLCAVAHSRIINEQWDYMIQFGAGGTFFKTYHFDEYEKLLNEMKAIAPLDQWEPFG